MLNKLSFKLIVDSVLIVDRRPKSTINTLRAKLDQGAARKKKEERHGVPGQERRLHLIVKNEDAPTSNREFPRSVSVVAEACSMLPPHASKTSSLEARVSLQRSVSSGAYAIK